MRLSHAHPWTGEREREKCIRITCNHCHKHWMRGDHTDLKELVHTLLTRARAATQRRRARNATIFFFYFTHVRGHGVRAAQLCRAGARNATFFFFFFFFYFMLSLLRCLATDFLCAELTGNSGGTRCGLFSEHGRVAGGCLFRGNGRLGSHWHSH